MRVTRTRRRKPSSLEEDAAQYAVPPWAIELRNTLNDTLAGVATWQEVPCPSCGSAQRDGRCKRPSGHDRAQPHPERADAFDRLVWNRAAERIKAFADELQARGFTPTRADHRICDDCGSPPFCPCVGPFGQGEEATHGIRAAPFGEAASSSRKRNARSLRVPNNP